MKQLTISAFRDPPCQPLIQSLGIHVAMSPYFFPERLDCQYDPITGSLTINFRYLDDEPAQGYVETRDPRVRVRQGKHTGRLLAVQVPVERHGIEHVQVMTSEIAGAIERAASDQADPRRGANFRLAEQALRENKNRIEDLVTA